MTKPSPTLYDIFRSLSQEAEKGVRIYDRRGRRSEHRPYVHLLGRAAQWADWARERGWKSGDTVFIALGTSFEALEAFVGCFFLGATPCFLAPPRALGGTEIFVRRLEGLFDLFERPRLLAPEWAMKEADVPYLEPPELEGALPSQIPFPDRTIDAETEVAFYQLTSGSTSSPKVVRITHQNLMAHVRLASHNGKTVPGEVLVNWLPLYHDMGLVGMTLSAFYNHFEMILLRPETFLGRPITWLRALDEHRASLTAAPNFAYDLCTRKVRDEQIEGLDLSCVRIACVGAEMVRPETMEAFLERFEPTGFPAESLLPCYGMAETTLAVTFGPPGRGVRTADGVVCCGHPLPETVFEVRDEKGRRLPDGEIGEVFVKGPCVFDGYHGNEEATRAALQDGWLATGDLAFQKDGELYITGRKKDVLIINGVNISPAELEWLATDVVDEVGARAAAFGVDDGHREEPALVAEVGRRSEDEERQAWARSIRKRVGDDFGLVLEDLALVPRGTLPKTTSGKVKRGQIKQAFLSGEYDEWKI